MASGLNAPYFVALSKGYFKDQGINASIVELSGTLSSTSLVNGSIQVSYSGSSAANAASQGVPVKMVASISNVSTSLIYTADPNITSLKQLEGKTFGVQALGDSYQEAGDLAFNAEGVDASKVQFVPLGAGNRTTAIASGRVAAGALKKAEVTTLEQQGFKLHLLLDLGAAGIAQSTGGVAASTSFLTKNSSVLERYLYAYEQGIKYIQAFPDQATTITLAAPQMKATGIKADDLEESIKEFYVDTPLPDDLGIPANVQTQLLNAKKQFLTGVKPNITTADVYDFTAVTAASQKLTASGWKPTQ
jgi:NitT/TauT family transport system substrate-binding protein